ncbi:TadE/TadG family type IV pilus assembly protein [Altererythrobacter sp.]|uniref:TadE/TadG family type IV pilus assembly protein n=1 Tax=Altererythrobacter sp. TaxID=1872480 RepID=UPI003D07D974
MMQFLGRLARDVEGNAMMLLGAALIPILAMIGGGLDVSVTYMTRNKLQNACDAGALAGRLAMIGEDWNSDVEAEANKFFDFNFPNGTNGVQNAKFVIEQDSDDAAQLVGSATASVPTTLMFIFGFDFIDIEVYCDAKRDMGHNDIMLVLDMTSSMLNPPAIGGAPKIDRLRNGVMGLYKALDDGGASRTRYGFAPFSQTVNVARQLSNNDIVREQYLLDVPDTCDPNYLYWYCPDVTMKEVGPRDSYWNNGQNGSATANAIIQGFRTSGDGCIEERPAYGNSYNDGEFYIGTKVTEDDINAAPRNAVDRNLQFGRYEPQRQEGYIFDACVSEAKQFAVYPGESDFSTAVGEVTERVTGGTYSDIGMLWGTRLSSRDGLFKTNNPKTYSNWPVNVHIIFFTDGLTFATGYHYSAYGVERFNNRVAGDGTVGDSTPDYEDITALHLERFSNICTLAKSMGFTVWVVALDTAYIPEHEACASSSAHFFESDGSDLEEKFTEIGQGIGNLRLTR